MVHYGQHAGGMSHACAKWSNHNSYVTRLESDRYVSCSNIWHFNVRNANSLNIMTNFGPSNTSYEILIETRHHYQ